MVYISVKLFHAVDHTVVIVLFLVILFEFAMRHWQAWSGLATSQYDFMTDLAVDPLWCGVISL